MCFLDEWTEKKQSEQSLLGVMNEMARLEAMRSVLQMKTHNEQCRLSDSV